MNTKLEDRQKMNRRGFLGTLVGVSGSIILPNAYAAPVREADRVLSFFNTHTGEKLTSTFWAEGQYQIDSMKDIGWLLRDHRAEQATAMDPGLLDMLHTLQGHAGTEGRPFHIISGYRSPVTNAKLRSKSSGVAKKSLHMQGRAIDIRVPRYDIARLRKAALSMKTGGVGYYPKSNFLHIDTGRTRAW